MYKDGGFSFFPQIDWTKIRLDVIKPWITKRVTQLLGMDDDVVTEFIFNQERIT